MLSTCPATTSVGHRWLQHLLRDCMHGRDGQCASSNTGDGWETAAALPRRPKRSKIFGTLTGGNGKLHDVILVSCPFVESHNRKTSSDPRQLCVKATLRLAKGGANEIGEAVLVTAISRLIEVPSNQRSTVDLRYQLRWSGQLQLA